LSLTLRDAQHLSWKTYKKFESVNKEQTGISFSAPEFAKKAGEIAEKMEALQGASSAKRDELSKLFSDLLFSLFVLAERNGISMEESFLQAVDELILGFVS
jgi:NTP pyrophosphatase (non-canonical NTP hydrolase)